MGPCRSALGGSPILLVDRRLDQRREHVAAERRQPEAGRVEARSIRRPIVAGKPGAKS